MEIKMSQFVLKDRFSILVHFPVKIQNVITNEDSGYVLHQKIEKKISVISYLERETNKSKEKILQSLKLVKFSLDRQGALMNHLTLQETKKVQLAKVLLWQSRVLICEFFFQDLLDAEKEYFKRLMRNLMYKKNIQVILIENDMNFVCETVKGFYLFTKNGKYKYIEDFYSDEIYKYVAMPFTVELIKYLAKKGHKVDHEITFNETLKAIYRGVQ